MNNLVINCEKYRSGKTIDQLTAYRNKNGIYIPKRPLKNIELGKRYYKKPYKYNTKKRILPFLFVKLEHDYMWFSR